MRVLRALFFLSLIDNALIMWYNNYINRIADIIFKIRIFSNYNLYKKKKRRKEKERKDWDDFKKW